MLDPVNPFQIKPPLRGYDDLFNQLLSAIPPGDFYDTNLGYPIVAWSRNPQVFILETDTPGVPVQISVQRQGAYHPAVDQGNLIPGVSYAPQNETTSFQVTMGLGLNRLIAQEMIPNGRTVLLDVQSTPNAILFEAMGREIFNSVDLLNQQQAALFSSYSTRLTDQVIWFRELLPEVQSLRILSTKMLVRGAFHFPAQDIGTRAMIQAFALNTPVFVPMRNASVVQQERTRIQRVQQNQAGMEAHVWFPNLSVTQWLAFTRMADSFRNNYQIDSISDDQVQVTYKGREQTHSFDFDAAGSNFLTNLSLSECFNNIQMFMSTSITSRYLFPLWTYTMDLTVQALHPIGASRPALDMGVPFDSGLQLDADPIDPWNDGWVGYSLSGRFEQNAADSGAAQLGLDSAVQPAFNSTLPWPQSAMVYSQGPYSQLFNSHSTEIDISYPVTASGTVDDYVTSGVLDHLSLEFPLGTPTPLQVGVAYPVLVKFADALDMTLTGESETVLIQESNGGAETTLEVTGGYAITTITPTRLGQISWELLSETVMGQSAAYTTAPGVLASFSISPQDPGIQTVGVPFSISIQALDVFGNPTTNVGMNTKLVIETDAGFSAGSVTPDSVLLANGAGTVALTCAAPGTGTIRFKLGEVLAETNTFSAYIIH